MTAASVESIISGTLTSRMRRSRKPSMSASLVAVRVLEADVEDLAAGLDLGAPDLGGRLVLAPPG